MLSLGDKAMLGVDVSADDVSNVTYQWYTYDQQTGNAIISGATGKTYETEPIRQKKQYFCLVNDGYGTSQRISFTVTVDNHLEVQTDSSYVIVPKGEKAMLSASVSADDLTGVSYQWYYSEKRQSDYGWYYYRTPIEGANQLS